MAPEEPLIPDLDWLAASGPVDDSWLGPGPAQVNLRPWMERLARSGHANLVAATYAAVRLACRYWDQWLATSPEFARESIPDGQPPTEQLAAVARWLDSPTAEHKDLALGTVDQTKQLHWFHEEFIDAWFNLPCMWAVESSEFCVLSLTGEPYDDLPPAELAAISVSCAVNSFRTSADDDIRDPLAMVVDAIRRQLRPSTKDASGP